MEASRTEDSTSECDQVGGGPVQNTDFCIDTEGTQHSWDQPTITMEQIALLGGWPARSGVIEVNLEDNTERTLQPGEVVHLRAGHAFCRRVRWKRGRSRAERIEAELAFLRSVFPTLVAKGNWILLPSFPLPTGWGRPSIDVAFLVPDGFPGAPPYGIYVPAGIRFRGTVPQSYTEPASSQPPFGGAWGMFSWSIAEGGDWRPTRSVAHGPNLLRWVRSFTQRFLEGA